MRMGQRGEKARAADGDCQGASLNMRKMAPQNAPAFWGAMALHLLHYCSGASSPMVPRTAYRACWCGGWNMLEPLLPKKLILAARMALAGSAVLPFGCALHRSEYALSDKPIASGAYGSSGFHRSIIRGAPSAGATSGTYAGMRRTVS